MWVIRMKITNDIYLKVILYVIECITLFFVFYFSLVRLQGNTQEKEFQLLKDVITEASIECYAVEGMYPPSVEYLEENYGVQIDRTKYNVFYAGFASNVQPDITIVPIDVDEILTKSESIEEGRNER